MAGRRSSVELKRPQRAPYTPCFVEGCRILTDRGAVAVEDLRLGDRVLTRDHGYRPIRWIGARAFTEDALVAFPQLRPITIRKAALDGILPLADLSVSPQHRMLVTDAGGAGQDREVLVAAITLTARTGVSQSTSGGVVYYHLMFDAHEVICSEGAWSESFLPEAAALDGMHSAQLEEILTIFPELATKIGQSAYGGAARACLDQMDEAPVAAAA
jgi:hypothetical protein